MVQKDLKCGRAYNSSMIFLFLQTRKELFSVTAGAIDPESIEEYIARGGYRAYVKAIRHYTYEEVCNIIESSGLRGRSGSQRGLNGKQALDQLPGI